MKRLLLLLFAISVMFTGCKVVSQQSGREDIAYLLFVGQNQYAGEEVEVSIDNAAPFSAKVVKSKKSNLKGTQYGISTGTRDIKVTSNGEVIYQKKIFVSTQEVKQIVLP